MTYFKDSSSGKELSVKAISQLLDTRIRGRPIVEHFFLRGKITRDGLWIHRSLLLRVDIHPFGLPFQQPETESSADNVRLRLRGLMWNVKSCDGCNQPDPLLPDRSDLLLDVSRILLSHADSSMHWAVSRGLLGRLHA